MVTSTRLPLRETVCWGVFVGSLKGEDYYMSRRLTSGIAPIRGARMSTGQRTSSMPVGWYG